MRVAHFAQFAPNACGLYHTAKDLVMAERLAGIDARFIAYSDKYEGIKQDGSFETEDIKWAYGADLLVRHSAIPTHLQCAGIPIVLAMHGRPESSFRLEQKGKLPIITGFVNKTTDCRYKAFITFWPEYLKVWSKIIPEDKLHYIPATVDLNEFTPSENSNQECNILIADIWREDVIPFNVIIAAGEFAKKHNGRVNIIGLGDDCVSAMRPFLEGLRRDGVLGEVAGQMRDIKRFYAKADIVATPHVIATRIIRESLACGIPIVAGSGCAYTSHTANPMDIDAFAQAIEDCWLDKTQSPRQIAEADFSLSSAGNAAKEIFDKILSKPKPKQRKVFIDLGGRIGETVRRFYREVDNADEYDIYSFEPDSETFSLLDASVGHIKNINLVNACAGISDGIEDFYIAANQNEGGTSFKGKLTGGVKYDNAKKVQVIDFARWLRANINDGDYVILKMNIEGGEYALMDCMLANDLTGMIDKCFIQLHAHKFEHGCQRRRFQEIEADFWDKSKCKCFFKNKGFYPFYAK